MAKMKQSPLTVSAKELTEYRKACPAFGVDVDSAVNDAGDVEVVVTIGFLPDDQNCRQCMEQDEGMFLACKSERDAYLAQKNEQEKTPMNEEQTQTTEEAQVEKAQVEKARPNGDAVPETEQAAKSGDEATKALGNGIAEDIRDVILSQEGQFSSKDILSKLSGSYKEATCKTQVASALKYGAVFGVLTKSGHGKYQVS